MTRLWFPLMVTIAVAGVGSLPAQDGKPACEPGYQIVEEIVYKEVCRFHCKVVPDIRKKWVYGCVEDAFCFTRTPHHKHGCAGCPTCTTHHRNLLLKREVEHCVGTKCVVEKTVELVPCRVLRKVPCAASGPPAQPVTSLPSVATPATSDAPVPAGIGSSAESDK